MVPGMTRGEVLTGGKGAKGRRSVLNVTQPRRKAKLQLAQVNGPGVLHLTVAVPRCIIVGHVISRRRERVKGERRGEGEEESRRQGGEEETGRTGVLRMRLARTSLCLPFSGAKFNCTCSCPDEKRESIIERCLRLMRPYRARLFILPPLSVKVSWRYDVSRISRRI